MKNTIVYSVSVKKMKEIMKHLNDDDMITLIVGNQFTRIWEEPKRICKSESDILIGKAKSIEYQDNDFFGRATLYGVVTDKNIVQSILFPQLE